MSKRVLAALLLLGLSLSCLLTCFRTRTPLKRALERELRESKRGTQRMLTQVRETSPGVLHVQLPGDGWLPFRIMTIWRDHPNTPSLLQVTLHPFHVARDFAPIRWDGSRRGQQFYWESTTPVGPCVWLVERWEVSDQNREQVQVQVLRTLQESGFGKYATDGLWWQGSANCSSKRLIRAGDFRMETLLEVLGRATGPFDLYLLQGAGNDFVEASGPDLPGWQQQLRSWQWSAQAHLLARLELLEQGMLVDLGWRTLEFDHDSQ